MITHLSVRPLLVSQEYTSTRTEEACTRPEVDLSLPWQPRHAFASKRLKRQEVRGDSNGVSADGGFVHPGVSEGSAAPGERAFLPAGIRAALSGPAAPRFPSRKSPSAGQTRELSD